MAISAIGFVELVFGANLLTGLLGVRQTVNLFRMSAMARERTNENPRVRDADGDTAGSSPELLRSKFIVAVSPGRLAKCQVFESAASC
ncbi:MAG TPA: hypothetical protein VKG25_21135 [Bryobacteraceae bacterium]|nr:hypothetical protein [Bryobacteraceae bacterium]